MTLNLPRWIPIATTPSIYRLLWVMCSFKNSPLFPIFVNWLENLTKWRLLSISSIPGWTFDDKCYLGGQKWPWPCPIYPVKAQTSLAPLSWFPGSHIPTAHVHQCCRVQSYANSHAIAYEIRKIQSVNHIPGIHDNRRPVTFDFNSVLESCFTHAYIYGILCVNGSFKCLAWALVFVN